MHRREMLYQCKTCGGILGTRARRGHLGERHQDVAAGFDTKQVNACFTRDIDPMHPGRAEKWGYTDADIQVVIPGLEPIPGEEAAHANRMSELFQADGKQATLRGVRDVQGVDSNHRPVLSTLKQVCM